MSLQDLPKSGSNAVGLGNTTAQASVLCLDFWKKWRLSALSCQEQMQHVLAEGRNQGQACPLDPSCWECQFARWELAALGCASGTLARRWRGIPDFCGYGPLEWQKTVPRQMNRYELWKQNTMTSSTHNRNLSQFRSLWIMWEPCKNRRSLFLKFLI